MTQRGFMQQSRKSLYLAPVIVIHRMAFNTYLKSTCGIPAVLFSFQGGIIFMTSRTESPMPLNIIPPYFLEGIMPNQLKF
jgi:hypothetical protein